MRAWTSGSVERLRRYQELDDRLEVSRVIGKEWFRMVLRYLV